MIGQKLIDYSWYHPVANAIPTVGVIRYLSYGNPGTGKIVSLAEINALHAAGKDVYFTWEVGQEDMNGGYDAGVEMGRYCNAMLNGFGAPSTVVPLYACDEQLFSYTNVQAFLEGAATTGRTPGLYGDIYVVDTMLARGACKIGWQTNAWSNNQVSSLAHIYQDVGDNMGVYMSGVPSTEYDVSVILKDGYLGQWLAPQNVMEKPVPVTTISIPGLNAPMVDACATPSGKGYYFVGADGGVFTRGDAKFCGSAAGVKLNYPAIAIQCTPTNDGYWIFCEDGGVQTFGDATFYGSETPTVSAKKG